MSQCSRGSTFDGHDQITWSGVMNERSLKDNRWRKPSSTVVRYLVRFRCHIGVKWDGDNDICVSGSCSPGTDTSIIPHSCKSDQLKYT